MQKHRIRLDVMPLVPARTSCRNVSSSGSRKLSLQRHLCWLQRIETVLPCCRHYQSLLRWTVDKSSFVVPLADVSRISPVEHVEIIRGRNSPRRVGPTDRDTTSETALIHIDFDGKTAGRSKHSCSDLCVAVGIDWGTGAALISTDFDSETADRKHSCIGLGIAVGINWERMVPSAKSTITPVSRDTGRMLEMQFVVAAPQDVAVRENRQTGEVADTINMPDGAKPSHESSTGSLSNQK